MEHQKRRDTLPEIRLRHHLHLAGLRFFVHRRPIRGLNRTADIVFPRANLAVFVDGCYWHGCPVHGTWPKANAKFWHAKIAANAARDSDTVQHLADAGWVAVRIWEHEDAQIAANMIACLVRLARGRAPS